MIANELVDDIARLDTLLKASKKRVEVAATASGTTLTEIVGIGPICAAIIIGYTGDIGRFPTKGHFATYNATAPVDASSGPRPKHRLNQRGNRKLNHAIHIAAIAQLRFDTEGPRLLRTQTGPGQVNQRRDPIPETADLGPGLWLIQISPVATSPAPVAAAMKAKMRLEIADSSIRRLIVTPEIAAITLTAWNPNGSCRPRIITTG